MAKDNVPEDLPFEVPEFNEDEFVRKELISFRTTVITFVYSLLIALVTFFIWRASGLAFILLFLLAMTAGAALPFLYRALRVDIGHFKRREWLGTMTLHFFFWLGFTLLLTNPPISDNAAPVIDVHGRPSVQGLGGTIALAAYIGDNQGIDENAITFCLHPKNATACEDLTWSRNGDQPIWTAEWKANEAGDFMVDITARDHDGRESKGNASIHVADPFTTINPNNNAKFERLSDQLFVRPAGGFEDLRAVQYVIGGRAYNMTPPTATQPYWVAGPTFPGWTTGNVNLTLQAVEQPVFMHNFKLEGGTAKSATAVRNYQVDASFPDVGTVKEPEIPEKGAPGSVKRSPGLESGIFLASLVILALVLRARRKD